MWSANEELRKIRENQERADFERWQENNPMQAEALAKECDRTIQAELRRKKEVDLARAKAQKEISLWPVLPIVLIVVIWRVFSWLDSLIKSGIAMAIDEGGMEPADVNALLDRLQWVAIAVIAMSTILLIRFSRGRR